MVIISIVICSLNISFHLVVNLSNATIWLLLDNWLFHLVLKKWLSEFIVKLLDLGEVDNWCSNLRSDVDGSLLNLLDLVLDELLGFGFSSDKGIGNWARWSHIFVVGGLSSGGNSLGLSIL